MKEFCNMTQILFPTQTDRPLVFYLAAEEYVARKLPCQESVFFWNVAPTVIFGRNQIMSAEVNLDWCSDNGVNIVRRKSGGGCVYADRGNLMVSYISPGLDAGQAFTRYLRMMSGALCEAGLAAEASGRNDISVGGMKVSGNAFYTVGGASIVHGTLMYDVDIDAMSRAITPSPRKLHRKGVESVRQRVCNLRRKLEDSSPGMFPDISSLASWLSARFFDESISLMDWHSGSVPGMPVCLLSEEDETAISELSEKYLDPCFILGKERQKENLL